MFWLLWMQSSYSDPSLGRAGWRRRRGRFPWSSTTPPRRPRPLNERRKEMTNSKMYSGVATACNSPAMRGTHTKHGKYLIWSNGTGVVVCRQSKHYTCMFRRFDSNHTEGRSYLISVFSWNLYRAEKKGWYVVARYFFLALLSFSAWPCLAVA